ncbi:hypothetical protein [Lachnospira pectinoschiza]|uniref:Uncharacterized protein n=1 Tax=Lachnospira pectinoschiza TaxID=28052 RepID=A0A1G9VU05_9FIRM|nr:hypothetical protein [Lachnospira pectinoschiza]SDM75739.1 hypothetical protein SAMN05216544_1080 [Lachnospira pectinoschiza]
MKEFINEVSFKDWVNIILTALGILLPFIISYFNRLFKSRLEDILDDNKNEKSSIFFDYVYIVIAKYVCASCLKEFNNFILLICFGILYLYVYIIVLLESIKGFKLENINVIKNIRNHLDGYLFGCLATMVSFFVFCSISYNYMDDVIVLSMIIIITSFVDYLVFYNFFVLIPKENSDIRIKYKGDELHIYKKLNNGYLLCGKEKYIKDASNIIPINIKDILENNEEYKIYYLKNDKMEYKNNHQPCGTSKEAEIGEVASDEESV